MSPTSYFLSSLFPNEGLRIQVLDVLISLSTASKNVLSSCIVKETFLDSSGNVPYNSSNKDGFYVCIGEGGTGNSLFLKFVSGLNPDVTVFHEPPKKQDLREALERGPVFCAAHSLDFLKDFDELRVWRSMQVFPFFQKQRDDGGFYIQGLVESFKKEYS
jgi:hypothetical protein